MIVYFYKIINEVEKLKMNEYFSCVSFENKTCKDCFYIMRPIREDLVDEYFPCQNPKISKMVKLYDKCSEFKHFGRHDNVSHQSLMHH